MVAILITFSWIQVARRINSPHVFEKVDGAFSFGAPVQSRHVPTASTSWPTFMVKGEPPVLAVASCSWYWNTRFHVIPESGICLPLMTKATKYLFSDINVAKDAHSISTGSTAAALRSMAGQPRSALVAASIVGHFLPSGIDISTLTLIPLCRSQNITHISARILTFYVGVLTPICFVRPAGIEEKHPSTAYAFTDLFFRGVSKTAVDITIGNKTVTKANTSGRSILNH